MANASPTQRSSRWCNAPICDRDGNPRFAALTQRDIQGIFAPLTRHRYLPVDYIHAFSRGSLDYLVNRLNLLFRAPNRFLDRPVQQRANAAANHRRIVYELAEKGWAVMAEYSTERPVVRRPPSFAHELMTSMLTASFEIGSREAAVRMIRWSEILSSNSLPEHTRQLPKPNTIPVRVEHRGKQQTIQVQADALPFGISRFVNGEERFFFCPGIEADCATEPIDTSDFQRASLFRKFVAYLAIEHQATYQQHFGFPNLYVPIVTTNATRLLSMMRLVERMTRGTGSKSILFKTFPAFTEKPPPPSGHMLAENWQRVGHPPFNFLSS